MQRVAAGILKDQPNHQHQLAQSTPHFLQKDPKFVNVGSSLCGLFSVPDDIQLHLVCFMYIYIYINIYLHTIFKYVLTCTDGTCFASGSAFELRCFVVTAVT